MTLTCDEKNFECHDPSSKTFWRHVTTIWIFIHKKVRWRTNKYHAQVYDLLNFGTEQVQSDVQQDK